MVLKTMLFLSWQKKKIGQIVSIIFFMFPTIQAKITQQIDLTPIQSSGEATVLKKREKKLCSDVSLQGRKLTSVPQAFLPKDRLVCNSRYTQSPHTLPEGASPYFSLCTGSRHQTLKMRHDKHSFLFHAAAINEKSAQIPTLYSK